MEEYKLAICQIRVRDGIISNYEKIRDITMCKNCEYWNQHKDHSYGICENLGAITCDNFYCIDGTQREDNA